MPSGSDGANDRRKKRETHESLTEKRLVIELVLEDLLHVGEVAPERWRERRPRVGQLDLLLGRASKEIEVSDNLANA